MVGGVQNSLQSALDLMAYLLGIIVSNPKVKIPLYILRIHIVDDFFYPSNAKFTFDTTKIIMYLDFGLRISGY